MNRKPEMVDVENPMSLLCENRPYVVSADGGTRVFCFRPKEIVSVIHSSTGQLANEICTFAELDNYSDQPRVVRLPGTAKAVLTEWILNSEQLHKKLGEQGTRLCCRRGTIPTPESSRDYFEWLDYLAVPILDLDYARRRLLQEHAFNVKAQNVPTGPLIGMQINPDKTAYIRLQSSLKRNVDVDLSEVQILFLLGLLPSVGESTVVSQWLKRYLPQILMPEILNLGRFNGSKFEGRLKNTIMQTDGFIFRQALQGFSEAGSSLALGVYMPDARLIVALALGDAAVLIFDHEGRLLRHLYSLSPGDSSERIRAQQNGFGLDAATCCWTGTAVNTSRGIGLFRYKSTPNKEYSRAFGAVSSMPEIAIQRLDANQPAWLCSVRSSQLKRTDLSKLSNLISANQALSSQKLCNLISDQLALSDFMISKLELGQTVQM